MNKTFLIAFGAALLAAALLVTFWKPSTSGQAGGKIGRVRAQKVDDNETIVILDFSLHNDSDRPRTVANTSALLHSADGAVVQGHIVGAADLSNVFRNYPILGDQYNPALKAMDELSPGQSVDRTIGIRFDTPDETLARRRDLVLDVAYINGPVVELKAP